MSSKKTRLCRGYAIFLFIYFIIILIIESFMKEESALYEFVKIAAFIFGVMFLCTFIALVGIAIVKYFVGSITNIHSSGDSLFDGLDKYNIHWGETKEHYQEMINVINFYYKKDGKVDLVIGNDLRKLYNRKEYLECTLETKDYLSTCLISVGLSICATLFLDYMRAGDIYPAWYGIIYIVLFFAVVLFKYSKIFNEGSNQIYKYELGLLDEKIKEAEKKVSVDYKREDMMLTKQNVLLTLIDKCKLPIGKKHDDIVRDIRTVERINLNVEEYANCEEVKFFIGKTKREGILFLDKNNKFINDDYKKLYDILRKHDLIYKIQSVENSGEDTIS